MKLTQKQLALFLNCECQFKPIFDDRYFNSHINLSMLDFNKQTESVFYIQDIKPVLRKISTLTYDEAK